MKILVLPDVQAKPGVDFTFLKRIGTYMVEKKPDVIVCIGDFADMESLSSYDKGKKSFEGRRYKNDIEAAKSAMDAFLGPFREFNAKARKNKEKVYKPRFVMTLGNHEDRINRAVNDSAELEGLMSTDNLGYKEAGWEVHPFLEVVEIEGVAFSHYFCTGAMGRPAGSAQAQLNKKHQSCIAGHQQGLQIASGFKANGDMITSIIAGSCLDPKHKVLTADLRYVPLGEIKVGDQLVSFDEHLGMSAKRSRRYKTGTVTNIRIATAEMFDVTLSSGKVFRTTKDHRWLTNNCMGVRRWQETQNLRTGKNGVKVNRLFDEWKSLETFDAGWLAGMYDGEGSLYARNTTGGNSTQLTVSQSESHNPELCEKLVKLHNQLGFELNPMRVEGRTAGWRIPGGQSQIAKFLGMVRPTRLLKKFKPEFLGTLTSQNQSELEHIVSVVPVGVGEHVQIEIDAKTMVVEGYGHHNCYEHEEAYLGHQGNKHWRGFVMLHDVQDGQFDPMFVSLKFINQKYKDI